MSKLLKKTGEDSKDLRVMATGEIWGFATVMLALCIPLSAVTKSGPILPLAALTGAAVGTVAVWRSDDKKNPQNNLPPTQVELLEQRLANLETIVSSEDLNLHQKFQQLEADNKRN